MAIEVNGEGTKVGNNPQSTSSKPTVGKPTVGQSSLGLLKGNQGGDITEVVKKMLTILASDKQASVRGFTRANFPQLSFDVIAVTYAGKDSLYYFTMTFEHTGYRAPTVAEYMEALRTNNRKYLTTDAVNSYMREIIEPLLPADGKKIRFMDGLLVPRDLELDDETIHTLTATGYDICKTEAFIVDSVVNDVSMKSLIDENQGSYLSLGKYALTDYHIDNIGRPRKVQFGVELSNTKGNNHGMPNTLGGTNTVVIAKGNLNYLPEEMTVPMQNGVVGTLTRYKPEIIINTIESQVPSLGYAILGIASAMSLAKDQNWLLPALENISNKNIGVLNRYADINGTGKGKDINLSAKTVKREEQIQVIREIVSGSPLISIDIEAFTESSHALSPFAAVAATGSAAAAERIHETIKTLSNGRYDYHGPIFKGNARTLPVGTWTDSKGITRTLDDIDIIHVVEHAGNNPLLISNFVKTELGLGNDTFSERTSQIQELKINAELTGTKLRIFFADEFITHLLTSLTSVGFNPRFDSDGIINTTTGFAFTQGIYDGASVSSIPGFNPYQGGNQFAVGGPSWAQNRYY